MSYLNAIYTNRRALVSDVFHLRKDMNRVFAVARGVPPGTEQVIRQTNTQTLRTIDALVSLAPPRTPFYVHAFTVGDVHDQVAAAREYVAFDQWSSALFATPVGHGWGMVPMWWPRPNHGVVLLAIVVSDDQARMTKVAMFGYDRV